LTRWEVHRAKYSGHEVEMLGTFLGPDDPDEAMKVAMEKFGDLSDDFGLAIMMPADTNLWQAVLDSDL
jgi:hypothetical protein